MKSGQNHYQICVVTGSRADFGLLRPLLNTIQNDANLNLQLVVTGAHLSKRYGETVREVQHAGFKPTLEVPILSEEEDVDSATVLCGAVSRGVRGFSEAYLKLGPDLVVVLGDRYEILAAALSAFFHRIPIAHIHGGEVTEGALDDSIRHSITKVSALHFVATDAYAKRVIQMGEHPERVFAFGAIGLDSIAELSLLSKEALSKELDFQLGDPTLLVTYHPATLEEQTATSSAQELLAALEAVIHTSPSCRIIFTQSNADPGGLEVSRLIENFSQRHEPQTRCFSSLGQLRYLSALQAADVVIGNSSSGILEAPSFGKPTVNIGSRQRGRIRAESVIDCDANSVAIESAIRKALSSEFQTRAKQVRSPYGTAGVALRIKNIIKQRLNAGAPDQLCQKGFYDLP